MAHRNAHILSKPFEILLAPTILVAIRSHGIKAIYVRHNNK
uniref:Thiamine pyrophosphate-binding protein n=1 Tax=Ascaris lumbricoides TaxID=6252 RepID=A0A0M3HIZ4_ASCLU